MAEKIYTASLVGCGRIGYSLGLDPKREQPASHTMALNANPRINLVAGCDTNSENLSVWQNANPQAKVFSSSDEMYDAVHTDIVVIAVNEDSHKKEALKAFSKHPRLVILEKPVALNINEALEISAAAKKAGVPVLINHERRFSSDYKLAADLLGEIGDVQFINAFLNSGMPVYNPREERTGAYSLIHDGTHLADVVLFFLERLEGKTDSGIKKISRRKKGGLLELATWFSLGQKYVSEILNTPALTGVFLDEKGCVRQASAHYSTSVCPDVNLSFSGRSRFFGFGLEIIGTEGKICVGNGFFKFYRRKESSLYSGFYSLERDKSVQAPKLTGYFSNMVQNAVDFLDSKNPLQSSLQTGINALAVLEEIKKDLRTRT